jgi:2-iminobutanoate/2-iminopropanoate deaminase
MKKMLEWLIPPGWGATAKEPVSTSGAPAAGGAYSQAIKAGGFVFAAGQLARDPGTNQLIQGDVKAQTERVLKNLAAVLAAAGSSLDRAVKTTVFLRSLADFAEMNEEYGKFFEGAAPARTTVQAVLPGDALVEIDLVALQ